MKLLRTLLVLAAWGMAAAGVRADVVSGQLANGIVSIVNDSVITLEDVNMLNRQTLETLARQYHDQPWVFNQKRGQVFQENLEKLVEQQLILHEFETAGYSLPESVIDDEIQQTIRQDYGDQLHLTMSLQQEGMTREEYRRRLRERIIVSVMRQKNIASEILISPHKVEAYYLEHKDEYKVEDEVKLKTIVLNKSTDTNAPSAEKLAAEILTKLKEKVPFEELARIYSPQSSDVNRSGGGWIERSGLRKELADAAFALKPGQYSEIVETDNACYILYVIDRRAAHNKTLGEMRDIIERNLQLEERNRLEKAWIDRLKKKTFVRSF